MRRCGVACLLLLTPLTIPLPAAWVAVPWQGLFQSMYFGYGRGLGALVGGFLYKAYGAMVMYRVAFGWVALGWAVNVGARFLRQRVLSARGMNTYAEI